MREQFLDDFQERVEDRLGLLTRWTRAIRHDLGNLMLPSETVADRLIASHASEEVRRFARTVKSMREQLTHSREALATVREVKTRDRQEADFIEWWSDFAMLGRSIFSRPVTVTLDHHGGEMRVGVGPSGLSKLFMAIFVALDLQLDLDRSSHVRLETRLVDGRLRVMIHVEVDQAPAHTLMIPDVARELALAADGELRSGQEAGQSCWIDVQLPAA